MSFTRTTSPSIRSVRWPSRYRSRVLVQAGRLFARRLVIMGVPVGLDGQGSGQAVVVSGHGTFDGFG
jgi:hypothetical protein